MAKNAAGTKDYGNYIVLNGKKLDVDLHGTDFSVIASTNELESDAKQLGLTSARLSSKMTRLCAKDSKVRDECMADLRKTNVAHHIYEVKGTGEELVIDDHIFLQLKQSDSDELQKIIEKFNLVDAGRMGNTCVLKVTHATGQNPVKTANMIAERSEVAYCSPQVMVPLQKHQTAFAATHVLFREQWYLTADLINHLDVDSRADIQAPEAWQITMGDPDIVVAVMDDGVDTGHPVFRNKRIHSEARDFDSSDRDPSPEGDDFHGTPVASIATGSADGNAMIGVAPGCTLLPIRIGFGPLDQRQTLEEFRFASRHADVVNCSFGFPPLSANIFDSGFRQEMSELTRTGGRRGRGLVIVFSAGNDDAPTRLRAGDNVNGVRYLAGNSLVGFFVEEIPAGRDVFSAYPSIDGTIVVAALSSRARKSGYSNWGPDITVTAPSSNGHELRGMSADFVANYRGLGQIGASNRPGHGSSSRPLRDDPTTPRVREDFYTDQFGGTSGAAPVVSGVAALMLSVNPELSATDVRNILMATADTNLDVTTDLANDPNLQGLSGDFVTGRSLFFGSGKVNALRAVRRAQALANGGATTGLRHGSERPNHSIPDANRQGIVSHIQIPGPGPIENVKVDVDISHTYEGDLHVTLITPEGFAAVLHRVFEGGPSQDLKRTYRASDTAALQNLVFGRVEGGGRWTLHVSDFLRRDVGTLNAWSIDLRATA